MIKLTVVLLAVLLVIFSTFASAEDFNTNKTARIWEAGFEFAELAQNSFRDLGPSNYSFFVGQAPAQQNAKWGWRFLSIKADLSNEHLRNEKAVCCINGNRDNLVGKLNLQRVYLDYFPPAWVEKTNFTLEFIPSIGIGYSNWYLLETQANEAYNLKAYSIGGNFRLKMTFYQHFFVEAPNIDLGILVNKNRSVDGQIGEAVIDRPNIAFTLLTTIGYKIDF